MFMVVLCCTCHNCNRSDALFSIDFDVKELPSLAVEREREIRLIVFEMHM